MGNKSSSSPQLTQEQNRPSTDNVFLLHSNHFNARQRLSSRSQSLPTNSLRVLSYQYNTWTEEGIPIHPEDFQNRRHSTVSYIPTAHRNRVTPIDLRPNASSQPSLSLTNSPRSGASSKSNGLSNNSPRFSPRKSPRSLSYSPIQPGSDLSSSPRPYSLDLDEEEVVNLTAFRLTSPKHDENSNHNDSNVINTQSFINPLNHHQFVNNHHQHSTIHASSSPNVNTSTSLPPLEKPNSKAHPKRIMVTPLTQLYTRTSSNNNNTNNASGTTQSNYSNIPHNLGSAMSASNIVAFPFKPSTPPVVNYSNSNQQPQIRRYSLSGYTMKRKSSISSPTTTVPKSQLDEHASNDQQVISSSGSSSASNSPTTRESTSSPPIRTTFENNENNQTNNITEPTPPITPKTKTRERSGSVTKILIQSPPKLNPMAFFSESHKRKQPPTVAVTTPDEPPCFDHLLNPPQESLPKKLKTKRNRSYSLPANSPKSPSKGTRKNKRF